MKVQLLLIAVISAILRDSKPIDIEFGAMLTDSAIYVARYLSDTDLLYSLQTLSAIRIGIGPSDYSLSNYDWTTETLNSSDFHNNIKIPFLKNLLSLRPDIKIYAAPWSPTKQYCNNNVNTPCTLDSFNADWYASMIAKWYEHYKSNGIHIDYLSMQNEPLHETSQYPSFYISQYDATSLRWWLNFHKPEIKVVHYDHNPVQAGFDYVNYINSEHQLYPGDVIAWHLYQGSLTNIPTFNDYPCVMTEITSSYGDDPMGSYNWHRDRINEAIAKQCTHYFYFNLFLNENYGPNIRSDGYKAIPLFAINSSNQISNSWIVNDLFQDFINEMNITETPSTSPTTGAPTANASKAPSEMPTATTANPTQSPAVTATSHKSSTTDFSTTYVSSSTDSATTGATVKITFGSTGGAVTTSEDDTLGGGSQWFDTLQPIFVSMVLWIAFI